MGYSPRGHKESDTTERLHFHFQGKFIRYNKVPLQREMLIMGEILHVWGGYVGSLSNYDFLILLIIHRHRGFLYFLYIILYDSTHIIPTV